MSVYDRVGGRQDGFGIDLYRAQKDAENLVMNGAKRVGFITSTEVTLEWLDPFLGLICEIDHPEKGFLHIQDISQCYLSIVDQWVIE